MPDTNTAQVVVQSMTIACPDGWADKSMLILNAGQPGPSGVVPNLVVTREPVPDGLPADRAARLEVFVDGQLKQMHGALKDLTEVARQHATTEQPSAELTIDWSSGTVLLSQWITYANAAGDTFVIATATAGRGELADLKPALAAMLETVRLA